MPSISEHTDWDIDDSDGWFRAVNRRTGYRSSICAAPAAAGFLIRRKAGAEAEQAAAARFLARRAEKPARAA